HGNELQIWRGGWPMLRTERTVWPRQAKLRCESGFARGYAGHASPLRSCVAAPRVARKGEAWCPWPESNQHSLRNSILSRARLPVPPQGPSDGGLSRRREAGGI